MSIVGTTPDYLNVRQWPLDDGACFTDQDVRNMSKVCLIGQTLALKQPMMFEKMVLADTGHSQPPEAIKQWEERIQIAKTQGMKPLVPSTMERWFTPAFRESPQA